MLTISSGHHDYLARVPFESKLPYCKIVKNIFDTRSVQSLFFSSWNNTPRGLHSCKLTKRMAAWTFMTEAHPDGNGRLKTFVNCEGSDRKRKRQPDEYPEALIVHEFMRDIRKFCQVDDANIGMVLGIVVVSPMQFEASML